jgi:hypothetical protein
MRSFCSGYGGCRLLRHGQATCRRRGTGLNYRVISTEQGKPVSLPVKGKYTARCTDGDAGSGIARKRMLPCNRADTGCVASMGQYYLTGNGADFAMVFKLETIGRTEEGSKANDDGANRWCSFPRVAWIFPPPCDSAANQYRVGLIGVSHKAASSFFMEALLSARAG